MKTTYKGLSIVFITMIVCYIMVPSIYKLFIPIRGLDTPIVNNIGLLILNISLVLIVVAQLDIDKEFFKIARGKNQQKALELLKYSERKFMLGLLIMFIGVDFAISSIIGSILVVIAFIIYRKNLGTHHNAV